MDVIDKAKQATGRLIENQSGLEAISGSIGSLTPNLSDSAYNAETDMQFLKDLLTTENLGLLKGVLSDSDLKMLASVAAGEFKGSDEKVVAAIKKADAALGSKLESARQAQEKGEVPLLSDPSLTKGVKRVKWGDF